MGKKVLFISGAFGLGHIYRDIAIARLLKRAMPDLEISWLTEEPSSNVLRDAGEKVLPEPYSRYNETMDNLSKGKEFNMMSFCYQFNKFWRKTFENYLRIVERERFDLVLGDEAYEVTVGYSQNPGLKKQPFIMFYDFIKFYPLTWKPFDRLVAWMVNRLWAFGPPIDMYIFLGEWEDVPDERLGLFLGNARQQAEGSLKFVGHPLQFNPDEYRNQAALKAKLGYGSGPLAICSVGGTGTGGKLIDICTRAYPLVKERVPGLQLVLVTGPSLAPESLILNHGIIARKYIPKLYEHFAACDLAVVMGGGTTTLELTALRKPFIYFPLEQHSEQFISVTRRLERHRAGIRMLFSEVDHETLAEAMVQNMGKKVDYAEVPVDGVVKAAGLIVDFMREKMQANP
jgi:UDP:flavonoid glycosyltransferase YjiC (YdhE family)